MKRCFIVFMVALSMVILLSPWSGPGTPQAASPTASTTMAAKPQTGGVMKILITRPATRFGYPPTITGPDRDFSPPFFNRLIAIGDDGKYQPELALSWDTSSDGKTITFKLRRGVKFHDGTISMPRPLNPTWINLFHPIRLSSTASLPSMLSMITLLKSISLLLTTSFCINLLLATPATCTLRRRCKRTVLIGPLPTRWGPVLSC